MIRSDVIPLEVWSSFNKEMNHNWMIKIWIFCIVFFVAIQCLCSSFVFLSIDNLNTIFLNGYRNDKNVKLNTTIISLWEYIHLLKTHFAVHSKVGIVYFLPLLLFFSSSRIKNWEMGEFQQPRIILTTN